ncbi:PTS transporter subunit EIIB [Bacillus sp. FSL W8-0116]
MTKEEQIAKKILQYTGGKENIRKLAHCMTSTS